MAKKPDRTLPTVPVNNQKGTQATTVSRIVEFQVVDGRIEVDTNPGVLQ